MSKVVNPDKMSRFDRQYLADRGIDPDEYAEQHVLDESGRVVARDEPVEAEEEEVPPYTEWKKAELLAELGRRNQIRTENDRPSLEPASEKNADLAAALEADDAEASDDESDQET